MRTFIIHKLLLTFSLIPLPATHVFGICLGWVARVTRSEAAKVTRTNIDLCFPNQSAQWRDELVQASLIESSKTITELGKIWFRPAPHALGLIKQVSGEAEVQKLWDKKRGLLLVTPHLGSWELCGLYCASKYPLHMLYRPPKIPTLEPMIVHSRARTGGSPVATDKAGIRKLFLALKSNQAVGILPDQDPSSGNGEYTSFFGQPAYTMTLLPRLAIKFDVPVAFVYAQRLPKGKGFHIRFYIPDQAMPNSLSPALAWINRAVEYCIKEVPEQYQWGYKRFKSRPPGQQKIY